MNPCRRAIGFFLPARFDDSVPGAYRTELLVVTLLILAVSSLLNGAIPLAEGKPGALAGVSFTAAYAVVLVLVRFGISASAAGGIMAATAIASSVYSTFVDPIEIYPLLNVLAPTIVVFCAGRKPSRPWFLLSSAVVLGEYSMTLADPRLIPGLPGLLRGGYPVSFIHLFALLAFLYVGMYSLDALIERETGKRERVISNLRRTSSMIAEGLSFRQTLLDAIPMPVFHKSMDGIFTGCNQAYCDFFGREGRDIVGKRADELFGETAAIPIDASDSTLRNTPSDITGYRMGIADGRGETRTIHVVKAVYRDADGILAGIIGVLDDVTDREALLEENRASAAMRARLLAIIGHDLVAPIWGFRQLVKFRLEDGIPDEETRIIFTEAQKSLEAIYSTLDNLLGWVGPSVSDSPLSAGIVQVGPVVRECLDLVSMIASQKGISLGISGTETTVRADDRQFRILVRNLVQNAMKFTPRGGSVSIRAERLRDGLELAFADTGIGMDDATLATALGGDGVRSTFGTEGERGQGLGLPLCRSIMERHGGSLRGESEPGRGTTITCFFPDRSGGASQPFPDG
ncbi:MAG: ATP-binding protein [Spirochaetes bacterium]|nr:ATP-binding protein [Spirochaetota bacterium]